MRDYQNLNDYEESYSNQKKINKPKINKKIIKKFTKNYSICPLLKFIYLYVI